MSLTKQFNQLVGLFDPHRVLTPVYEMPQTKPQLQIYAHSSPLPRSTPEAEGISSRTIAEFLKELSHDETLNMHNILIVRHGKVILDFSFRGYPTEIRKYTYSACKSLVSLAIGVLIDRKILHLDDKIENLLPPNELNAIIRLKIKDITLETLLTMASGCSFNELNILTEENWLHGFLSANFKLGNDKLFEYNSMNTYVLSVIAIRAAGISLTALLKEAFFDTMGIDDYYFETCPLGYEKGGWGLYMRPEDLAKFGVLILNDGIWNGKRLISEEYLKKATSVQRQAPAEYGDFHYGYQIWVGRNRDTVLFNGMHGQNTLIDRVNDLVIVTNAGNNEMFQQSAYFDYVAKYFYRERFPDCLKADLEAEEILEEVKRKIQPREPSYKKTGLFARMLHSNKTEAQPWLLDANKIVGKIWYPTEDRANCMGIFPRILQITRGSYTSGLQSFAFAIENDSLILYWNEKEQKSKLLLGFGKPTISELMCRKEVFAVGSEFRFGHDEDDRLVLLIRIDVLEMPYTRLMKFRFFPNGDVLLSMEELPGKAFLLQLWDIFGRNLKAVPIIGQAIEKVDPDYPEFVVSRVLEPTIRMSQSIPSNNMTS